jgi:FtsP/CotA-like multicopper oxidase with cupredoxin domain
VSRRLALPFALLLASGCAPLELDAPAGDNLSLVPLTDTNPDPDIVEVTLVASPGKVEYLPGKPADVWAYRDGAIEGAPVRVPGPLLEANVGDRVIVHFRNELPDGTTVHWHGLRLPAAMDGARGAILRDSSFDYEFTAGDPGTFWYHPHIESDEQIERGLYGPFVVHEGPDHAGERHLVLDDVKLNDDGTLSTEVTEQDIETGRHGNILLVNGKSSATMRVAPGSLERWRLTNAANGRYFDLALPGHTFEVIGWDGGLLGERYTTERLLIAPGERYDVLVALEGAPASRLALTTAHYDPGHGMPDPGPLTVLELAFDDEAPVQSSARERSEPIEPLPVDASTVVRPFVLTEDIHGKYGPQFFINSEFWPFNTPIDAVRGDLEIWEIRNAAPADHPFHLHGMFFQVLDRDGIAEARVGWKDTVLVRRESTLRFAVRYEEPGLWMYHCQVPEHAERGMMGEVQVGP